MQQKCATITTKLTTLQAGGKLILGCAVDSETGPMHIQVNSRMIFAKISKFAKEEIVH